MSNMEYDDKFIGYNLEKFFEYESNNKTDSEYSTELYVVSFVNKKVSMLSGVFLESYKTLAEEFLRSNIYSIETEKDIKGYKYINILVY